ncbi:hypothetical protein SBOR_1635 [Sclerotinia borealis F-4128]|uniref:Uncharacterized protein n=1 Tax=Sclerotinia borealis (strain F-4128) TaxID=1432307 RepID=W9CTR5_SCLBF|nr:hypothetical protein SBOR_1635 [Sclerotinia borealis F-4128]
MAHESPAKTHFRSTLPPASQSDRHSLTHSHSQSQLQSNVHARLGPWAQWGQTSASLSGLDTSKRPRLTHSLTTGEVYHFNKNSPPAIPSELTKRSGWGSRRLDGRLNEYGDPVPRPSMDISGSTSYDDNVVKGDATRHRISRIYSSPETRTLPTPPEPPMTKSATKVMQRTGYDPTMEIKEGKSRQSSLHIVTDNSDSSGSSYSQEGCIASLMIQQSQPIGSVPVSPMEQDEMHVQSYDYNCSNVSSRADSTAKSLMTSPEYKERVSRFMQGQLGEPNTNRGPAYTPSLEDLIDQEKERYEHRSRGENPLRHEAHNDDMALMPAPLVVRTKKSRQSYFSESPEGWESQHSITPISVSEQQQSVRKPSTVSYTSMAPPPIITTDPNKSRKRGFSSGKHPLKSPFPFLSTHKTPDSPKATGSPGSLSKKFSGAMKRFSGTITVLSNRNEVIPNARRSATGPDTPMPKKSGFMGIKGAPDVIQKGNEHIQGAVEKARLRLSKKERRRKELKKQIVVVGIMDQTPG